MKVIILAGGLGTRAKPFTDFSPKAMIPVNDRPLIDYIVRYVSKFKEVDEVVIVSNFEVGHGDQIKNYFNGKEDVLKKKISYAEDRLDGTGGALLKAEPFIGNDKEFLVWFSDNLCPLDINAIIRFHKEKGGIGCISVRRRRREETGFAKLDGEGLIIKFREKPLFRLKNPECLGIYIFNRRIFDYIRKVKKSKINMSFDVLQKLPSNEKLFGFDIGDSQWIGIESLVTIEKNLEFVKSIVKEMEQFKPK